jgi:hypothetical protein
MMLMPVGIINERHEPPVYYGVERPFVDTSSSRPRGSRPAPGIHGEVGRGWRYRAFVTRAAQRRRVQRRGRHREGGRRGRSQRRAHAHDRPLEYVGYRGLTVGASWWDGDRASSSGPRFDVPVKLAEADARYSRDRFEGGAIRAGVDRQRRPAERRAHRARRRDPNIGRVLRGFYAEGGYRSSRARFGDVGAFTRYENFDTQLPHGRRRRPAAAVRLATRGCSAPTTGPTRHRDQGGLLGGAQSQRAHRGAQLLQLGLGWWF